MKKILATTVLAAIPGLGMDLSWDGFRTSAYADFGVLQNRSRYDYADPFNPTEEVGKDANKLHRLGFRLGFDHPLAEDLRLQLGIGGLLWRPQLYAPTQFYKTSMNYRSELPEASIAYGGSGEGSRYRVKAGSFPYKYNPDSRNLGEYLYRSQGYPTIIRTSQDWDILAPSRVHALGLSAEWLSAGGSLSQAVNLFSEQEQFPLYDITPSYLIGFRGFGLDLGAGLSYHRYFDIGAYPDPKHRRTLMDSLGYGNDLSGVQVMVRAALIFSEWLNLDGSEFKIYGEAAWLGLKNRAKFYENINERRPLMLGLALPRLPFVWDGLRLEVEHLNNPYLERDNVAGPDFSPLPVLRDYGHMPGHYGDDWRWSVQAERDLGAQVAVKLRVASDHLRLYDSLDGHPGAIASNAPVLDNWRDCYFLVRLEWGQ